MISATLTKAIKPCLRVIACDRNRACTSNGQGSEVLEWRSGLCEVMVPLEQDIVGGVRVTLLEDPGDVTTWQRCVVGSEAAGALSVSSAQSRNQHKSR